MSRRASVRYFESRGAFYTQINGKQIKLVVGENDYDKKGKHGPNYLSAVKAHAELVVYGASDHSGDANTVRILCEKYAEHLEAREGGKATLERFQREAVHFTDLYGERLVGAIKPIDIDKFKTHLTTQRNWTMTKFPLQQIKNSFVWGIKKKIITNNPFDGVDIDDDASDVESQLIPKSVADAVIAAASPYLRDLLTFLRLTGCRPNEAYNAQAKHYRSEHKCVFYSKNAKRPEFVWKNARKTKKDRSIYLYDEMVELIESKIRKHPTGFLFRTKMGKPWNRISVYQQINRVKKNLQIDANVTAYGWRHTFITNKLMEGKTPIHVLGELCGTSVDMIQKTYSHIAKDKTGMRDWLLLKSASEKTGTPFGTDSRVTAVGSQPAGA